MNQQLLLITVVLLVAFFITYDLMEHKRRKRKRLRKLIEEYRDLWRYFGYDEKEIDLMLEGIKNEKQMRRENKQLRRAKKVHEKL